MQDLDRNALDRWITGNYGEDFFPDDGDQDEEDQPDEYDGFVLTTSRGTEASFNGKSLGVFADEDEAEQAIRDAGNDPKGSYWPNVWRVSDHGDHHLIGGFWS